MSAIERRLCVLVGVVAASAIASGIAFATIPDAVGSFHGCVRGGNLRLIDTDLGEICRSNESPVTWSQGGAGEPANGCDDVTDILAGTWTVTNHGQGETGQVTFNADGSYTIDSGTYEAGGTFTSNVSGTYQVAENGGAILFHYDNSTSDLPWNRIAMIQCGTVDRIATFVLGHTHGYEVLTR